MWGYHDGFGWWMMFGGMWMLIFWGIVIWLVVWGVNKITSSRNTHTDSRETPLDIAQRRLANGEITKEEFEEIRAVLHTTAR